MFESLFESLYSTYFEAFVHLSDKRYFDRRFFLDSMANIDSIGAD